MMAIFVQNRFIPRSLSVQIKNAEQQVLNRQRRIGVGTDKLVRKTRQQMTSPASLLLASGIGFILGELTKRKPASVAHGIPGKPRSVETSPLRTTLSLVTSIQTLYTALPIAWMIKTFNERGRSGLEPEQPVHHPSMSDSTEPVSGNTQSNF